MYLFICPFKVLKLYFIWFYRTPLAWHKYQSILHSDFEISLDPALHDTLQIKDHILLPQNLLMLLVTSIHPCRQALQRDGFTCCWNAFTFGVQHISCLATYDHVPGVEVKKGGTKSKWNWGRSWQAECKLLQIKLSTLLFQACNY